MNNIKEIDALKIARSTAEVLALSNKLPDDLLLTKEQLLSEVYAQIQYLDQHFKPGPMSFKTFCYRYLEKRTLSHFWKMYDAMLRQIALTTLDDPDREYGECDEKVAPELVVQPQSPEKIDLKDAVTQLRPPLLEFIVNILQGHSHVEAAKMAGIPEDKAAFAYSKAVALMKKRMVE